MKTVKWVLEEGKELPFTEAPYSADIYYACRASNIMIRSDMTCREVLSTIEHHKATSLILNMKLDDLVSNVDSRFNRMVGGWFAFLVFGMCLAVIAINGYTAYRTSQFLSWDEFFLPLVIGGMIVWNRMKILNDSTAKAISTIVSTITPGGRRRDDDYEEERKVRKKRQQNVVEEHIIKQEYVDHDNQGDVEYDHRTR